MVTLKCLDPLGHSRKHIIYDSEEVVGEVEFEIKETTLNIFNIMIKKKCVGYCYQTFKYLVENKNIKTIESQLTNDNLKIFYLSLNVHFDCPLKKIFDEFETKELLAALDKTPAMRARKKLNFCRVLDFYPAESDGLGKKTEGIFIRVERI